MRADMGKVITERPRARGGDTPRHGKGSKDFDNLPYRESTRIRHRRANTSREFTDLLGPIRRFIEGTAGRRWDRVFSEISEQIDGRKVTHRHILEHVDQFIAIKVQEAPLYESHTGLINHGEFAGYRQRRPVNEGDLYVDPVSGIVRRAKRLTPRVSIKKDLRVKLLAPNRYAVKQNGIWYDVETATYDTEITHRMVDVECPPGTPRYLRRRYETKVVFRVNGVDCDSIRDCFLGTFFPYVSSWNRYKDGPYDLYGKVGVYGKSRKQMPSADLRRNNLKND